MAHCLIQGFLAVPNVNAEHRGPPWLFERVLVCDQIQTNKPPILFNIYLDCLDLGEIPKVLRTDILRPLPFMKQMHYGGYQPLKTLSLLLLALHTQGKDIVFRFIIEYYSSWRHSRPYVISLFLYEDFWNMIFWLVLKLEIIVIELKISWRILVSFRGFYGDYIFAWWNVWVSIILLLPFKILFNVNDKATEWHTPCFISVSSIPLFVKIWSMTFIVILDMFIDLV